MRLAALLSIIVSEILILGLLVLDVSADKLSLISTLVVVVITAFASSALLRNINSLKSSKNYLISGILGLVIAFFYYVWAQDNLTPLVEWLRNSGIYFLMLIILLAALGLFFSKPASKPKKVETKVD
ncbi:MAG: hypothetical protein RIC95_00075 [Vicingaceae bacterium]